MERNNHILEELKALSDAVASIGNGNIYTVPAGYFETLSGNILTQVKLAELNKETFTVPIGYFDELGNSILLQAKLLEATKVTYTVPAGYFEGLSNSILFQIKLAEHKVNTYTAPAGYFETLPAIIMGQIQFEESAEAEIENLSPLLAGLKNKQTFSVPEGYFDQKIVVEKAVETKVAETPVVQMKSRRKQWIGYAAAAVVTGIVLAAGFNWKGTLVVPPTAQNVSVQMAKLSDDEIVNYLDNTITGSVENITDTDAANLASDDLIQLVSDNEIEQYLKENEDPKDKS